MTEEGAYSIQYDRELVLEFFLEFSRFEYCLKRGGFLRKGIEEAVPDWDTFAKSLRGRLTDGPSDDFRQGHLVLTNRPPKKQMVTPSGGLGWRESTRGVKEADEAFLLRLVRTVRNNLFHGGKFPYPDGPVQDPARGRDLVRAALDVLRECRRVSPRIDSLFQEAA